MQTCHKMSEVKADKAWGSPSLPRHNLALIRAAPGSPARIVTVAAAARRDGAPEPTPGWTWSPGSGGSCGLAAFSCYQPARIKHYQGPDVAVWLAPADRTCWLSGRGTIRAVTE